MEARAKTARRRFARLNSAQLTYFFEQLSLFSGSGIATWECLAIMKEHSTEKKHQALLDTLFKDVSEGSFLSESMDACRCFPDYALGMMEVGEQTGRLQEVSSSLKQFYENKERLSRSIRASLVYPLCMSAMVLAVIFVLLVQVMPVFEQVFSQLGLALNPISVFLLELGRLLGEYTGIILGVVGAICVIGLIIRVTPAGKKLFSKLYSVMPLTKKLFQSESANRFAFAMFLMLGSGIDTLIALDFSLLIADNDKTEKRIKRIIHGCEKGRSLSEAVVGSGIFQPMYNAMLIAGMRSGTTEEMFRSISEKYYEEAQRQTDKLLSILEPTLVAILCIIVGMVMLSVMLPLTGILSGM